MRTASSSSSNGITDEHRPEDLLLRDRRVGVDVDEQRRLHEVALVELGRGTAADDRTRALGLALLDVPEHALALAGVDQRTGHVAGVFGSPYGNDSNAAFTISTPSS